MAETKGKFDFAIDRGGTFTDVFARLPDGRERVLKLLSRDPQNYKDAPTEGIRRVLEEVRVTNRMEGCNDAYTLLVFPQKTTGGGLLRLT